MSRMGGSGNAASLSRTTSCIMQVIGWFWSVVHSWDMARQRRMLAFVTGSDRVPIRGLRALSPPFGASLWAMRLCDQLWGRVSHGRSCRVHAQLVSFMLWALGLVPGVVRSLDLATAVTAQAWHLLSLSAVQRNVHGLHQGQRNLRCVKSGLLPPRLSCIKFSNNQRAHKLCDTAAHARRTAAVQLPAALWIGDTHFSKEACASCRADFVCTRVSSA
jgi:hypothetical protein